MLRKINNVTILTMNENDGVFYNSSLVFKDDTIVGVNDDSIKVDEVIDGKNGILIPGMVNTHTHIGMVPFRSLGDDIKDRLKRFLFPLETSSMNERLAMASSRYAVCEMLLGGTTTFFDMYYFEESIARAIMDMNIRAILSETIIDFKTCDTSYPFEGLDISERILKTWKNDLISFAISPHAPYSTNKEVLIRANELSKKYNVLLSMHVSEMDFEMKQFRDEYNMTPVEYLESIGLLSDRLLAVHCINTSESDIDLFKKHNVRVAHCPGSNSKGGRGIMPLKSMVEKGVVTSLGSDGAISANNIDLFLQMALAPRFQKMKAHDRSLFKAKEILNIATLSGAKALRLDDKIGSLEIGKKADLVLIETDSVNMFPIYDPYSVVVYSANASNVDSVWVNGVNVVKNKKLLLTDLKEVRKELEDSMIDFKNEAIRLEKSV